MPVCLLWIFWELTRIPEHGELRGMHQGFYNIAADIPGRCCQYYEPRKVAAEAKHFGIHLMQLLVSVADFRWRAFLNSTSLVYSTRLAESESEQGHVTWRYNCIDPNQVLAFTFTPPGCHKLTGVKATALWTLWLFTPLSLFWFID